MFEKVYQNQVNIISIFGKAREGKSFLMNCLAGESNIFKISNKKDPCTQGIDISTKWSSLGEFASIYPISGSSSTGTNVLAGSKIRVGYVDAEGQGDRDVNYDAKLVCPILLASKCVVFNWKATLQKDQILTQLGIMTRAAKNVSNEGRLASSSSSSSSSTGGGKLFGHLHIVFRDWSSADGDRSSVYSVLFDEERGHESQARNQIRKDVLASFESVSVWLFDAPVLLAY